MKKLRYRFVTTWCFDAPADHVWALMQDAETMPKWWSGVRRFEVIGQRRELQVGSRINAAVGGLLGELVFTLEVVEVQPGKLLRMKSTGDLDGEGIWKLDERDGATFTSYSWDVTTTGSLMNLFGLVFKPVLVWNHNRVMAKGYRSIKTRLAVLNS